jgi:hypothetical protein
VIKLTNNTQTYSVPYLYIGRNVNTVNQQNNNRYNTNDYAPQYPDWYRMTPAYSLSFSGRTKTQLIKDLVNRKSKNNLVARLNRWYIEPQTMIYCDRLDKVTTIFKVIAMLLTITIIVWQYKVGAQSTYIIPSLKDKTENSMTDTEKTLKWKADRLSKLTSHPAWQILMITCSVVPMMITAINVFKRTTMPARHTEIGSFTQGTIIKASKHSVVPEPHKPIARSTTMNFDKAKTEFEAIPSIQSNPTSYKHIIVSPSQKK